MKKKLYLILICFQLLTILSFAFTFYQFEKRINYRLQILNNKIVNLNKPISSDYFCQSSINLPVNKLGNSQTSFCNINDARIWANNQILSIESKWSGMKYEILEIADSKGKVYYSIDFCNNP